ncbi:MAG: conserved repeat domain protein [halophilic archaeon J07HX64]|nr:MAG: conserved repeat domain protein [halophilic archaeon J07HX64]
MTLPETVEWTVSPADRGVYELGPLEMRVHGPLGLVERPVRETASAELVVYPRRYDLTEPAAASGELHTRQQTVTQEFDRVREYNPGDPLRKVDWKSSAKHSDLHVVEFSEHAGQEAVVIVGVAANTAVDRMARTVATLAEAALDAGLDVGVTVPAGHCEPDSGPAHRERLLRLLARTGPSTRASDYTTATTGVTDGVDIVVDASDEPIRDGPWEPTVRTAHDSYSLGELRAGERTEGGG